jgi:beta-xylosidase
VPQPPIATTGSVRSITQTGVILTGSVDPKGEATTYHFAYGPSTAYGSATPARQAGWGNTPITAAASISGLQPATIYHYRLVATSRAGTTSGADETFTTAGSYQNPVYGTGEAADPFILDNGGTHSDYWAYVTGFRFPMLHSTDLVHWTAEGAAMSTRPSWVVKSGDWHPWAPSLLVSDEPCPGSPSGGCYVMYYTGLSAQFGVNCIGVATSPLPGGPFVDQGPLDIAGGSAGGMPIGCGDATSKGNIDPSPFVDPSSGQPYLYVSTNNACTGGSCTWQPTISVLPLSADFLHVVGSRVALFAGDPGTWEAAGIKTPTVEGPAMTVHDGTYYLFYSGGNWQGAYGMGYATSSSPTGPFTKSSANPILAQTSTVIGPGGGDRLVTGPHDGVWLAYAARSSLFPSPRTLRIDPLSWASASSPGAPDAPVVNGPTSTPQLAQP